MSVSTPASAASRGAMLNLVRRLHFYLGLFVAPFIFVAALTGTLYVLTPQLENVLYKDALYTQPLGQAKPLSAQISAARRYIGPQAAIYAVRPTPSAQETTRVQFTDANSGPSESRALFVDPYTLKIKGDMTVYGTSGVLPLRTWLDHLHQGLLLGDVGRNYSELAASWLWVVALGGMALWLGTRPRRVVKKVKNRVTATRRWHITLGMTLLTGLLFFSATGLTWSQWAGNNIDKMRTDFGWLTPQVKTRLAPGAAEPVDAHAEHHASAAAPAMPMPMPMDGMDMSMPMDGMDMSPPPVKALSVADSDWDSVLAAARAAGIAASKVELRQPKNAESAWVVSEIDRSWPSRVDSVSVNPTSFAIVDHVRFADFPLLAKLTRWGVDAHMGVLFGLPNQLLLAAFGIGLCAMIVLGYRLWWLRRPTLASNASPAQTLFASWLALSLSGRSLSLLLAVVLGYCLPVMGTSLLLFLVIDILRWRSQQKRSTPQADERDTLLPAQQSPLSIIQQRVAQKKRETRKFLCGVAVVFIGVGSVMTNAIISGVIEQYNMPFNSWTLQMYVTQGFMVLLYTSVFTALFSVPLWYFFLGENDER